MDTLGIGYNEFKFFHENSSFRKYVFGIVEIKLYYIVYLIYGNYAITLEDVFCGKYQVR